MIVELSDFMSAKNFDSSNLSKSHEIAVEILEQRRQNVFLILCSIFIATMALLNVIGITKFIEIGPMTVAVGILPYPLTFLCTDLISELYGRKKANFLVLVGVFINVFVLIVLFLGEIIPSAKVAPPWQTLNLAEPLYLADGSKVQGKIEMFHLIFSSSVGAIFASMVAYLTAQFVDVQLFHYLKKLTKGKHLWIRNNGSTMVSQLVDSVAVIGVTFGAAYYRGDITWAALLALFWSNYLFKFIAAALDTLPFYYLTRKLSKYLQIDTLKIED